jgi:hypothetical protein
MQQIGQFSKLSIILLYNNNFNAIYYSTFVYVCLENVHYIDNKEYIVILFNNEIYFHYSYSYYWFSLLYEFAPGWYIGLYVE